MAKNKTEHWRNLIAEQESRKQKIRPFCRERGISEPCFYYSRSRLRKSTPVRFAVIETTPAVVSGRYRGDIFLEAVGETDDSADSQRFAPSIHPFAFPALGYLVCLHDRIDEEGGPLVYAMKSEDVSARQKRPGDSFTFYGRTGKLWSGTESGTPEPATAGAADP